MKLYIFQMNQKGAALALLAAILFGVSPTLVKSMIGGMSPVLLAGLLYFGSGIGLLVIVFKTRKSAIAEVKALTRRQRLKLQGSILFGGILGPLCLAYGIKYATAAEVSLLLNFETVTTTVIAALVFREHVSLRVWLANALLVIGAVFITTHLEFRGELRGSFSALIVLAACLFWGIDNNLTRDIDTLSPTVLATFKGLVAGVFNIFLGLSLGAELTTLSQTLGILTIGALSYGLSLVLFIQALRSLGSSRTGAYFASGPFFGMLFAIVLLGERPLTIQWLAAFVMALGLVALFRETHDHLHEHELITHRHEHVHDEHHQHMHTESHGPEPHVHTHTHEPIIHAHWHLPDIHHRHEH